VTLETIREQNHILTPGRYVGIAEQEDDGVPFEQKMAELTAKLAEQMGEEQRLNAEIRKQFKKIGWEV